MKLFRKTTAPAPVAEGQTAQSSSDTMRDLTNQTDQAENELRHVSRKSAEQIEREKWEQRRWELTRYLVSQDRRSVVLGKLNLSDAAIARRARQLADATIEELRNNKMQHGHGKGSK